tara:strand:- start:1000 stop:1176 length:177 start_codon:yes stop_codon:yes gene_type:complete
LNYLFFDNSGYRRIFLRIFGRTPYGKEECGSNKNATNEHKDFPPKWFKFHKNDQEASV